MFLREESGDLRIADLSHARGVAPSPPGAPAVQHDENRVIKDFDIFGANSPARRR